MASDCNLYIKYGKINFTVIRLKTGFDLSGLIKTAFPASMRRPKSMALMTIPFFGHFVPSAQQKEMVIKMKGMTR